MVRVFSPSVVPQPYPKWNTTLPPLYVSIFLIVDKPMKQLLFLGVVPKTLGMFASIATAPTEPDNKERATQFVVPVLRSTNELAATCVIVLLLSDERTLP